MKLSRWVVATLFASSSACAQAKMDWSAVETSFGRKGAENPGGVMRFSFPRSDLSVTAHGIAIKPAFALGGWVAMKPMDGGQVMAMGDLVLLEDEIPAVMKALQAGGVNPTALHNHLAGESPHVMYMHIMGHGTPAAVAKTIHDALALSKTPMTPPAAAQPSAEFDTAAVAKALGVSGRLNGVVYQVSVPRAETISEMGHEVPPSLGAATAINFQPAGNGKAAITGDFVLIASEVESVAKALKENGIDVTAMHSHMVSEQPRLTFMHFWAVNDAATLAKGLRAALDKTNSRRP